MAEALPPDHPLAIIPKNKREDVRLRFTRYADVQLIDVRVFTDVAKGGPRKPSQAGVAIALGRLPQLAEALTAAVAEARRRGLLPPA